MSLACCDEVVADDGYRGVLSRRPPAAVDIEVLIQTVLAPGPTLPWARDDERELSGNHGLTARPRRRPRVTWFEAEACAGMRFHRPRSRQPRPDPGPDAARVLAAIRRLDPADAAMVIACGREKIRPDWMPGVEPRRVSRKRSHRKWRRGRGPTFTVWEPCPPETVRVARAAYRRWHSALLRIGGELDGMLDGYDVTGLFAPAQPWGMESTKMG